MGRWLVQQVAPTVVHVTPIEDLIDHDRSTLGSCICGPRVELVVEGGGWLVTHASLDGRELTEGSQ